MQSWSISFKNKDRYNVLILESRPYIPRYCSNNLRWMDMRKSIHIDFLYILSIYLVQQIKALLLKIHVHICIPGEFCFSSVVRPLDMHCQPRCLDFRGTKNVVLPTLNTPGPWLLRISLTPFSLMDSFKKVLKYLPHAHFMYYQLMRFLVYFDH